MGAAVTSVTAKWQGFSAGLTTDERAALSLALREAAGADATADDVAGHDYAIELAAKAYVDALPIWDTLQKAIAEFTRPIKW